MLVPLLALAVLGLAGCAVPVAGDYGYPAYESYDPAYPPPATYVVPSSPPVIYGAPPVMLGGQIWIDSPPRPAPWRWRGDRPRHHGDWRGSRPHAPSPPPRAWQHDGDRGPRQRPSVRPPDAPRAANPPPQTQRRWPEGGEPGHRRGQGGGRDQRDFP